MDQIIYICGRGHSGSTMLDAMLGNSSQIESVGELVAGMRRYDELCSCGEPFANCEYWRSVRQIYESQSHLDWDSASKLIMRQAHLKSLAATLIMPSFSSWTKTRVDANRIIFSAIAQVSRKQIVLDSSKEFTRALFFIKHLKEAKIIHLVKNPFTVMESSYHRLQRGTGVRFLRYNLKPKKILAPVMFIRALGWLIGNSLAELASYYGRARVLRVRYEDIVEDPLSLINRIEQFLNISLSEVTEKLQSGESFEVGHNIGGNNMRMSGTFNFDPSKSSRGGLPRRYRIMTKIICSPLMKRYSYIP